MTEQKPTNPSDAPPPESPSAGPAGLPPAAAGTQREAGLGAWRWQRKNPQYLMWVLLAAALALAFGPNIAEMWVRWFPAWNSPAVADSVYDRLMEGESYYTHAPLVPLVSLVIVILLVRHTSIPVKPSPLWGGVVVGVFLLGHLMACLARVNFASGFALIGLLAGLILLLWGSAALRRMWFPLAMLFFMVPLPEVSIAQLNFKLKMMAADWGVNLAEFSGVVVERLGNKVFLQGDKQLVIANVCNGLRTLISLLAFGALYAYVCRLGGLWRIFLFVMSVPIAVVANSVRIVTLIVVADIWDAKVATGFYHDASGIMIFVMAFLLMFGLEKLILACYSMAGKPVDVKPLFDGRLRTEADDGQGGRMCRAGWSPRAGVAAAALLLSAAGAWWFSQVVPTSMKDVGDDEIRTIVIDGQEWQASQAEERVLDEQTLTILEHPKYVIRMFRRLGDVRGVDPGVELCAIFSKDNRKGVHPPDLCLEGGGQDIIYKETVTIKDVKGIGSVQCRLLIVQQHEFRQMFLYTYKCGEEYTTSFWVQQMTIFTNGLLRRNAVGALIRGVTQVMPGDQDPIGSARRRAEGVLRESLPELHRLLRPQN